LPLNFLPLALFWVAGHEHQLSMAKLLGVDDKAASDALNATPGDRQLDRDA
jgi:hypothetical protein